MTDGNKGYYAPKRRDRPVGRYGFDLVAKSEINANPKDTED